jgi:hypothetical protein
VKRGGEKRRGREEVKRGGEGRRKCLAPYCLDYLENIGFVYHAISMIVIGHSLLY